MNDIEIIKDENKIEIKKFMYSHSLSTEKVFISIATYHFNAKLGYTRQYTIPKEYKSFVNWKKAVKRVFDIDV